MTTLRLSRTRSRLVELEGGAAIQWECAARYRNTNLNIWIYLREILQWAKNVTLEDFENGKDVVVVGRRTRFWCRRIHERLVVMLMFRFPDGLHDAGLQRFSTH